MGRGRLEEHVLQEVGHARFAITLVAQAHQDRQVNGQLGARRGRETRARAARWAAGTR